jgi:hypothetical protein
VEPGSTLARVDRRPEAGREAAGEEAGAVEGSVLAHVRERDLGHHGVLGEGRGAHEVAHRLAVARQARGAVGQIALVLLLANGEAEIRARIAAVGAFAALRREERHHVVAGLDGRDAVADRLDDAGALVPQHRRRVARRVGSGSGEEVGVADAAGNETDEHLTRFRLGEIDLLDGEWLAKPLEHGRADLHGAILEPLLVLPG